MSFTEDQAAGTLEAKPFRVRIPTKAGPSPHYHCLVSAADHEEAGLAVANEFELGEGHAVDVIQKTAPDTFLTLLYRVQVDDHGVRSLVAW